MLAYLSILLCCVLSVAMAAPYGGGLGFMGGFPSGYHGYYGGLGLGGYGFGGYGMGLHGLGGYGMGLHGLGGYGFGLHGLGHMGYRGMLGPFGGFGY